MFAFAEDGQAVQAVQGGLADRSNFYATGSPVAKLRYIGPLAWAMHVKVEGACKRPTMCHVCCTCS